MRKHEGIWGNERIHCHRGECLRKNWQDNDWGGKQEDYK